MIPYHCSVKHDPDAGTYGDCVRACVASIMEFEPHRVPHFFHDNPGGIIANERMVKWMRHYGFAPLFINCDAEQTLSDLLDFMGAQNPHACYMLFGRTADEDHVVVCRGGEIVHDPAWCATGLIGPNSSGYWQIMVVARS